MRTIGTICAVLGGMLLYMAGMYQGPIRPMLGAEILLKLLNSTANLGLLGMVLAILGGCLVFMGTFRAHAKKLDTTMFGLESSMIKVLGNGVVTMVEGIKHLIDSQAYQQGREDMRLEAISDPSVLHTQPEAYEPAPPPLAPAQHRQPQMPPLPERKSQRNGALGSPHH
ncbi:MAG TPA: hypothetical protein VHP58_02775 [Alphaproteobacteria bacterium]|nr:hypothetical protein [Alphaproteobacteria bacterium]